MGLKNRDQKKWAVITRPFGREDRILTGQSCPSKHQSPDCAPTCVDEGILLPEWHQEEAWSQPKCDQLARLLHAKHPLNDAFGNESKHPKRQDDEKYERTELSGLGFTGQVQNDEQHVKNKSSDTNRQAKLGYLSLGGTEQGVIHEFVSEMRSIPGGDCPKYRL